MRLVLATLAVLGGVLVSAAPALAASPQGLVAAYSFDEGSGSVVNDASGNGHLGTISGATWATGHFGGALSFNGTNASVLLDGLGTFYQSGFTLEAWVQKQTASKNDVAVLGSFASNGGGPMLWVDHLATHYQLTLGNSGLTGYLDSGHNPIAGQWQHLAATYDGTTARFYIDGVLVASRAVSSGVGTSNIWRIGAYGTVAGGFFDGLIDNVRIYSRALSDTEVQTDMNEPVTMWNAGFPSAPTNLAVTATTQTSASVQWSPSTDDVGVAGYNVYLDGTQVGNTATTSFTFTGLSCSTSYQFGVEAVDGSANVSPRTLLTASSALCDVPVGLVAAYSFDEGSGGLVNDASGNGHLGTISGATWATGHFGSALSFNGTNASVDLGGLGTFYQTGFTLEAWVQKQTASKNDVAVLGSWTSSAAGPMIWVDHVATRYQLTLNNGLANYLDSGHNPIAGQWQHLAATFDGTTARFYIDGVLVASRAVSLPVGSSNTWRIGAYGASPTGFFDGLIDNVRIYNRALTLGQIDTDMNVPVTVVVPPPDTTPPSAPGTLTANAGASSVALSWGAATDNVGVTKYDVYRSTTAGFTPSVANRIAQPTGTSYSDTGLAAGSYFYRVAAEDAAGNVGAASNEATATVAPPDTTPPTVSVTAPAGGATVSGLVTVTANAADNQAVAGVQFRVDGQNVGAEDTASPYSVVWDTRGELNGSHTLTAVARDGAGNTATSASVAVTVSNAGVSSAGLRAAYGFDDGSGTTAVDSSGNNKTATVVGGGWTSGQFGGAVSLNGTTNEVDPPALGTFYKTGFTYEAWVYKQSAKIDVGVVGSWTTQAGGAMIWVDHITGHYRLTLGSTFSNYLDSGQAPAVGRWQHVAATYDGTTARFYIDGTQVATSTFTGNVGDSNSWRIGAFGATASGFFDGNIDNVRIYDRALSAAEIQTDMASRIQPNQGPPPDTTPPSAPGTLVATAGTGQVALSWGAATDNVGVTKYDVYRSTTAGFTPSLANRIAQPTGTSYTDTGLANGTYHYKVTAEDAAGNVGAASNEATATIAPPDTTPPTVSITAPAGGASLSGLVTVTANAADNQAVAGVQFRVDGHNVGAEDTASPYSVVWDTRGELNGSRTITAVARDGAGNTTTSAAVVVTVSNTGVSSTGLRAAYGLDDGSGTTAVDSSGNNKTATVVGGWTSGHFGGAVALNGTTNEVDPPALGTFYKTGFTYEAWVYKQSAKVDVGVVGSWVGGQAGGAMIWVDHITGHYRLTLGNTFGNYLDSGQAPAIGQWQHVAATYDGTTARFYIDGTQVATTTYTANVGDSNSWRIGAYGATATGFFDGNIDNVRIYDRALSAAEILTDMASRIQPDHTPPTVTSFTPANGANAVNVGVHPTATFSKPMNAGTVTASTFVLKGPGGVSVPASVSYDGSANVATLTPLSALQFGVLYTATVKGGAGGVTDTAGNALAADVTWSFTTDASQPTILVVTSATNPFSTYLTEVLRNEGLDDFTTIDVSAISPAFLSQFDVVVLGEMPLSAAQVSTLSGWVSAGGNLVAMRPDKQLAGLLGLTDAGGTLANAYLKVDTSVAPGAGIVGSTVQFHGTADRYSLSGATAVASLYSDASTATSSPAVSLRSVGSSGGQAAAFTFDLARSVVYTRQGNPAWAGQERDGVVGVRPDDMFFGAKSGDVQPDWLDTSKIAIPQADEQQRLLVNLITVMERDKLPLPHFWYLPRGKKAVVVMSGDDHSPTYTSGGTASNFDRFKALSPPGCVVANWECVRSTSWIFPDNPLTNAQAAGYIADGFDIDLHPVIASCPATVPTLAELAAIFDTQLAAFEARYTSVPAPESSRTHCVEWPDWVSEAKIELARGIRMDGNYYHYPAAWIGDKPGFMTGGGFPMRFADLDGSLIDVYQENTNMTDESGQAYPATIDALLDNALGPNGYYGAFGTNIHTDFDAPQPDDEAIVASAQARGVPIISYKQLLDWTDGRNDSTIRGLSWNAGTFTFVTTVGDGANGLQTLLPTQGPTGTLSALSCAGSPKAYTLQTIKGIQYAMFDTITGTCQATYS